MKNRIFSITLSFLLILSMVLAFAACGKEAQQTGETTTATTTVQTETTAPAFDPLGKYDPAITLKMANIVYAGQVYEGTETALKNSYTDLLTEMGINLDYIYEVDESQAATKLGLAIASGDYPDLLMASAPDYVNWAKNGVITDVTGMYDTHLSDHGKEWLEADGGLGLQSAMIDGKKYGIPWCSGTYDSVLMLWIRSDWLKNLNLEAPKTVDELIAVADAFTNKDPDKNGKKDTYGLTLDGTAVNTYEHGIQTFIESFGAYPGTWGNRFTFIKSGDEIVWGGTLPGMKDGLAKLNEMYKAGTVAKDFATREVAKNNEDITSGKAGMFYGPMWGCMSPGGELKKNNPDADLIAVPIPGIGGPAKTFANNSTAGFWCISSKFKNPEVLFSLFNMHVEKICFPKDQEEYGKYNGKPGQYTGPANAFMQTWWPVKNYENYLKLSVAVPKKDPSGLNTEQKSNYDSIMKYYDNPNFDPKDDAQNAGWQLYKVFADPNGGYAVIDQLIKNNNHYEYQAYNGAPTELMGEKFATLDKMLKETIIKIIYGEIPVSDYDKFLTDWNNLGGADIVKEANDWYKGNNK